MSYAMDNREAKGTALYTKKLISGLLQNIDFDFYLVHYEKVNNPLYQKAHEILMPQVKLPFGSRFVSQLIFFWKYRKQPFDVMHWFQPRMYPFYSLAPAKRIIVTMHGAGDVSAPTRFVFSRFVFNFVLKYFHRSVDTVIVVSEDAKKEVVKYYGIPEEKIQVTYNGGGEDYKPIPKEEAREVVRRKYDIRDPYIFDLSRLQPHKNVRTLIHAYNILREKYPEHTEKLIIVGKPTHTPVEEYIAANNSSFSKDIIFKSFVAPEDLNAFYSASSLFVFPSLSEGFGLPVLEAMASGAPAVTSDVTSMPEIGGDAVSLIPPLNPDAIALAMHNVLHDGNLRQKMVELGLQRATQFTWKKMVEKTKEIYRTA